MKKTFLILLVIACTLLLLSESSYLKELNYVGDQLAIRSTDPRITEIAHITTTPTLNQYEIEVKTLWDSLFTKICSDSAYYVLREILPSDSIGFWTRHTPKELVDKQYNGARVFYMQDLEIYDTSCFMSALYNSKLFLLPMQINELYSEMNIHLTTNNSSYFSRKAIELSTSSQVTFTDSTISTNNLGRRINQYAFWEQRNGIPHYVKITHSDSLFTSYLETMSTQDVTGLDVIFDNDNRNISDKSCYSVRPSAPTFLTW